jgi:ribosomal RNA-processing protein 17
VNQEDEYIDEDKYTTVTIESVGISRDGFEKAGVDEGGDADQDKENGVDGGRNKRVWTKEKPKTNRPTIRKKKFRYESKADRKTTRMKQGAKNRAQAQARKSQ